MGLQCGLYLVSIDFVMYTRTVNKHASVIDQTYQTWGTAGGIVYTLNKSRNYGFNFRYLHSIKNYMEKYKDNVYYVVYNINTHLIIHTSSSLNNKVIALIKGGGLEFINVTAPANKDILNEINIINETEYGTIVSKMDKTIYYALRVSRNDLVYFIALFEVVKGEIEKIGFVKMPSSLDPDWELLRWLDFHHNDQNKFNFKLKELKISVES